VVGACAERTPGQAGRSQKSIVVLLGVSEIKFIVFTSAMLVHLSSNFDGEGLTPALAGAGG
jgi:hypothetical protein